MSIFQDETTPTTEADSEAQASFLEELVAKKGERFRDPNEIAKKALHADTYIEQLKAENAKLKAYEEMIEGLKKDPKAGLDALSKPKEEPTQPAPAAQEKTTQVAGDIEAQVLAILNKKQAETQTKSNLEKVEDALYGTYGDRAKEVVRDSAAELGMSLEALANMAGTNPNAFLRLVGVGSKEVKQQARSFIPTSVNTEASPRRATGASYFESELTKNPKLAYDSSFMMKWAEAKQKEKR